jgi:hypothetical protein
MKNLYLLPTDKPSKLYRTGAFILLDSKAMPHGTLETINQHIYITSDEEIKEGDWVAFTNLKKWFPVKYLAGDLIGSEKKIILTTDQDLINDGVQAIDDEFLEWFVKNPSCEFIEVIHWEGYSDIGLLNYEIIISQEEPKQDYSGVHLRHCYQGEYEDGCKYGENDCPAKPLEPKPIHQQIIDIVGGEDRFREIANLKPKQETPEQAAEKWCEKHGCGYGGILSTAFEDGTKWQAERMYSEEEVYSLLCSMPNFYNMTIPQQVEARDKWFEQFKKK